jgi:hypothetical protein
METNGDRSEEVHIQELASHGISAVILSGDERHARRRGLGHLVPKDDDLLPGFRKRDAVREVLEKVKPDALFMYHWDALAATHGIHEVPKFGGVGDPAHLPYLFRRQFYRHYGSGSVPAQIKGALVERFLSWRLRQVMNTLLLGCDACGAFAAHHASMFREMGIKECRYLRTPILDPIKSSPSIRKSGPLRILHIGHLQGIATLSGVELLATEVLPELKRLLGSEPFEIHLVGGHYESMPQSLKRSLADAHVRIRGHISPPDEVFHSSHMVLVPTPIELGIRVRILTAFAYGACVVAHRANQKGIPELQHRVNGLVGRDGRELASLCVDAWRDGGLRQEIEVGARRTYLNQFSMEAAGSAICATLEGLCEKMAKT